jgi:hypothetical protein
MGVWKETKATSAQIQNYSELDQPKEEVKL